MRYEIGIALLAATLSGAGWAWRHHVLAQLPNLRRRRTELGREMIDIPLARLVPPVAAKPAVRRRPF
jgi:hypothetical protein